MRFRVSHPELVDDLMTFLADRVNVVVQRVDDDEVAVSVLGSFSDGGDREFATYVEEWTAAHPEVAISRVVGGAPDADRVSEEWPR